MLGKLVNSRDIVQAGVMFNVEGNGMGIMLFNDTAGVIALGDVVQIIYDVDGNDGLIEGMQCGTPEATAWATFTAVALESVAVDDVGQFQISGVVDAYVEGTSAVAKGDFLEVLDGENEYKKEGTVRTANNAGIALAAQAAGSNVLISIYKFGEAHVITS